jgi:aspartate/methionine/tyrosine aminotransferase
VDFCTSLAQEKGVVCTPMSVFYSTAFAAAAPCTLVRFTVCKSREYVERACEALVRPPV